MSDKIYHACWRYNLTLFAKKKQWIIKLCKGNSKKYTLALKQAYKMKFLPEAYLRLPQTSKMEKFFNNRNDQKPLTIVTKCSILDVLGLLNTILLPFVGKRRFYLITLVNVLVVQIKIETWNWWINLTVLTLINTLFGNNM